MIKRIKLLASHSILQTPKSTLFDFFIIRFDDSIKFVEVKMNVGDNVNPVLNKFLSRNI